MELAGSEHTGSGVVRLATRGVLEEDSKGKVVRQGSWWFEGDQLPPHTVPPGLWESKMPGVTVSAVLTPPLTRLSPECAVSSDWNALPPTLCLTTFDSPSK